MNKVRAIRAIELLFFAVFLYITWCLAYEITVAARYNPALYPSEGRTRFALLQLQQVFVFPDSLFLAPKHFWSRLHFPATQGEAILRALIALGGVVGLGAGLAVLRLATKPAKPFGDATFGSLKDAGRAKLLKDSGIVLGRLNGVPLRSADDGHLLVVGPTRSGKGVGFVLPNLYEWQGSALVLDWKSENFDNSAMHRVAMGQKVYKFAPGHESSHRYNPLDFVRRNQSMPTDCDTVALFIIKAFDKEDIWPKAARLLVSGLIGYVLTSSRTEGERHLRAVARMLVTGEDLSDVLGTIIETEGGDLPRWIIDRFRQYMSQPEKTRGSVLFNLNTALSVWSNDLISSVTQTSDFDIRNMRKDAITIYVCCNISESRVFNLLISLLIQQIHDLNMRSLPSKDDRHSVLLLLDEFYYAGRMIDVLDKVSISAGYGFRMAIVVQSIAQLDEIYGRNMRTLAVSSCNVQLIMKVNDNETAKYVSDSLGSKTVEFKTYVNRPGAGLFAQKTMTPHLIERPLMTTSEVKEIHETLGLLFVGSTKPIIFKKIRHYEHQPYKKIWISFINKKPDIPLLPEWTDKPNLIVDDGLPSKPVVAADTTADRVPAIGADQEPHTLGRPSMPASGRGDGIASPAGLTGTAQTGPAPAGPSTAAKKPLTLAAPIREGGEVISISRLVSGTDDVLQADIGEIEDLARTAGSSTDHDSLTDTSLTGTLDAFGEDDPIAAALLRAQRANARQKARLSGREDPGEPSPEMAPEEEPEGRAAPLDGGSIQEDGEPPEEGGSLANAFRQAKQANLATQGRPLSLEKPAQGGRDDTMSSLAASLQKSAEKASSRAPTTKGGTAAKKAERSAPTPP